MKFPLEIAGHRCPIRQVFLKLFQNSQGNTYAQIFFNKVAGLRHRCFPINFEKLSTTCF